VTLAPLGLFSERRWSCGDVRGRWALQRFAINPTLGRGVLPPLIVTFGLSMVLQNALLLAATANARTLHTPLASAASRSRRRQRAGHPAGRLRRRCVCLAVLLLLLAVLRSGARSAPPRTIRPPRA